MKIIYNNGTVAECPAEDELQVIRHSAAHILAQAVKNLYPQAHFAYGPATESGFYYDIDLGDVKLTEEDLPAIEKEMQAIVKKNLPIKPFSLSRDEAIKLMEEVGIAEPHKRYNQYPFEFSGGMRQRVMIAMALACQYLVDEGWLGRNPIKHYVAGISAGIVDDEALLDLQYSEDSRAQVDLNCVMNELGEIIELQGTGEGRAFTLTEQQELVRLCAKGNKELLKIQKEVLEG